MLIKSLKRKYVTRITEWIKSSGVIEVDYPDITCNIIDMIIRKHTLPATSLKLGHVISSLKEFKEYNLKKIL